MSLTATAANAILTGEQTRPQASRERTHAAHDLTLSRRKALAEDRRQLQLDKRNDIFNELDNIAARAEELAIKHNESVDNIMGELMMHSTYKKRRGPNLYNAWQKMAGKLTDKGTLVSLSTTLPRCTCTAVLHLPFLHIICV